MPFLATDIIRDRASKKSRTLQLVAPPPLSPANNNGRFLVVPPESPSKLPKNHLSQRERMDIKVL